MYKTIAAWLVVVVVGSKMHGCLMGSRDGPNRMALSSLSQN